MKTYQACLAALAIAGTSMSTLNACVTPPPTPPPHCIVEYPRPTVMSIYITVGSFVVPPTIVKCVCGVRLTGLPGLILPELTGASLVYREALTGIITPLQNFALDSSPGIVPTGFSAVGALVSPNNFNLPQPLPGQVLTLCFQFRSNIRFVGKAEFVAGSPNIQGHEANLPFTAADGGAIDTPDTAYTKISLALGMLGLFGFKRMATRQ